MMTAVLRHRDFRRLWVATTIDSFGSWLLVMAVPLQVFALTGSAMSTGLALAVRAVPAVIIGPWAGVAVDRWPRKRILVTANLASAAGVTLMLAATTPDRVGYLFAGLLVESVTVCFLRPALRAVTPSILPGEDELASANSLSAFSDSALRMIGPLTGTFLVALGWFEAVVVIDAVTYAVAAALVTRIAIKDTGSPTMRSAHVGQELRDGLRHVLHSPLPRGLLATSWVYWTGNAALTAMLVPFTVTRLPGSGQALGYLIAGLGVGYVGGSTISRYLIVRYTTHSILTITYTTVGLCFLVMVNTTTLPIALVAVTAAGVPGVVATVAVGHRLQTATPNATLGRVSATFYTSDATAAVTGALIGTAVLTSTTLGVAMNTFSAVVLSAGVMATVLLHPKVLTSPHRSPPSRPARRFQTEVHPKD